MKRAGLLAAICGLALLVGCNGGGPGESSAERAIRTNLLRVAAGWQNEDPAPFFAYYSSEYDFDEMGKDDHLASIFDDFPFIRNWRLSRYTIAIQSATFALVRVNFSMELFADIASLDQPAAIEAWAPSSNQLAQVWKRDFDGVWRVAAEYLAVSWVLGNTPDIGSSTVLEGDEFLAGRISGVSARGVARDASERVVLFPDSVAAEIFDPDSVFGWRSADYSGDFVVRDAAFGEYAFSWIGQTDRPPRTTMLGRRIEAVFIVVSRVAGEKPVRQYRPPTGARKSVFRLIRIHGSAGQNPRPQPRPR